MVKKFVRHFDRVARPEYGLTRPCYTNYSGSTRLRVIADQYRNRPTILRLPKMNTASRRPDRPQNQNESSVPSRYRTNRDPLFTEAVRGLLRDSGVKPLRLPASSPNLNAYAERFVLSIRRECLDRFVPLSERHLRTAVTEYVVHYHTERNHQGLGNELCRQARRTLAPSCRESDSGAFSSTTAVPRRLSLATVAPRWTRSA